MSDNILKSLFGAGVGVLGSVVNTGLQNYYNEKLWNKQNEYNSPEQTMQRLTQAGINPRAYQQLGQFANAQPQVVAQQDTGLSKFADVFRNNLELQAMQLQNEKTKAEINTEKERALDLHNSAGQREAMTGYYTRMTDKVTYDIGKIISDTDLNYQKKDQIVQQMATDWLGSVLESWKSGLAGDEILEAFAPISPKVREYIKEAPGKGLAFRQYVAHTLLSEFSAKSSEFQYDFMVKNGRLISAENDYMFDRRMRSAEDSNAIGWYRAKSDDFIGRKNADTQFYRARNDWTLGNYNLGFNQEKFRFYKQDRQRIYDLDWHKMMQGYYGLGSDYLGAIMGKGSPKKISGFR